MEIIEADWKDLDLSKKDIAGVLIQYPNTDGSIESFSKFVEEAHSNGVCI